MDIRIEPDGSKPFQSLELKTRTLYRLSIGEGFLETGVGQVPISCMLENGRASYIIFENIVRMIFGLRKGVGSDHCTDDNKRIEQKSFPYVRKTESSNFFHTSSSSTFGANNYGPMIKEMLANGDYDKALEICLEHGYSHNDYYIYTNTGKFKPGGVLEIICLETKDVLANLSETDPRKIDVRKIYGLVEETVVIDF